MCAVAFPVRFIAKKLCTACSRTNNKIVPLTNLNKYLYNGKSGIKVNVNNTSEKVQKQHTATFGKLIKAECVAGVDVYISCT
jgi:hypothetical protein